MKILKLDHYGRGIVKTNNKLVFVDNAITGEDVEIKIYNEKKKYSCANVAAYNSLSKDRVNPLCKYYGVCGGCNLMHIIYESQVLFKKEKVEDILKKFLKKDIKVSDFISYDNLNYRNKVVLHVIDGKCGFYESKTNKLVEIDKCLLLDSKINNLVLKLKDYVRKESKVNQITIKLGNITNEVMIIIDGYVSDYKYLLKLCDCLVINNKIVTSKKYIESFIGDRKYVVRSHSFFQVNYNVSTSLYDKVLETVIKKNSQNVLDLYCGSGTIGIYISDAVKHIIGVEVVEDAILDALENQKINNVSNIEFILGKVENNIEKICNNKIDTVIVDPPRSGLDKRVIDVLLKMNINNIIYVSCDPITMARDLNLLDSKYNISEITAFDMFPNTYHVECVSVLQLQK